MSDCLKNIFIGMVLGVSNIIPGVSAGSMAVVMGIYDKLIDSVCTVFKDFKRNFKFLFFLGIGVLLGIILFSSLMEKLLISYPWQMNYLFMGLIIGGIGMLFKEIKEEKLKKTDYIYFLIPLILLIAINFISSSESVIIDNLSLKNALYLLICGFVASSTMVIPGVSGSFILILLGAYGSIISAVSNFNLPILFPFGIGVLLGLIVMVKLIEFLLKRFKLKTYMCIVGLVIGSLFSIFPGFEFSLKGLSSIVMFVVGYAISFYIPKLNSKG